MSGRKNLVLCALLATFVAYATPAYANIYPPTPIKHFYGDANGDTGITGVDLVRHKNYILSKSYTYDTLQPQTPSQLWNTCDIDSDRGCTGQDVVYLTNYILSNPVSINDKLWHLQNYNLPETGNSSGVWISFSANLFSTHPSLGDGGRPGISVIAEIDAAGSTTTGELSGRTCSPVSGSRDQAAATGAQCALTVTVTDWATPGQGLTEPGAYGFQIKADGEGAIKLNLFISAIPGLDIPAATVSITTEFLPPESIDISCPSSVYEPDTFSCVVIASGPSSCSIGPLDTCGGSIDPDCAGSYQAPAQGEEAGPGSCIAEVVKGSASDSASIAIYEVQYGPVFDIDCLDGVPENSGGMCNLYVFVPGAQEMYCGMNIMSTTCYDVTFLGCSEIILGSQGDLRGEPWTCHVGVHVWVIEPFYVEYIFGGDVDILKQNVGPTWQSAPTNIRANINYPYDEPNGEGWDYDLPSSLPSDPGYLACSKESQTCSFDISVSGSGSGNVNCDISFPPPTALEECDLTVKLIDGEGALVTAPVHITITEPSLIYADYNATGLRNGTSWVNAFVDIVQAVNATQPGDTLWVAEGRYPLSSTLDMKDYTCMYGGFIGNETELSQRPNPFEHPTILDAESKSLTVVKGSSHAVFDGFQVTGSYVGWGIQCDYDFGGAMFNNEITDFTIKNCLFNNNISCLEGGAIRNEFSSDLLISNTIFDNNFSQYCRVEYYCFWQYFPPYMYYCWPINYYLYDVPGGAIYDDVTTSSEITNCLFTDNGNTEDGGAIYGYSASVNITNSTFWNNSGSSAIFNEGGSSVYTLVNSILWNDSTTEIFGGANVSYSDVKGGCTGTGNIDADPLFVGFPDLHLQSGSPCINAGTSTDAPLFDLDGNPRPSPLGGLFDMGAYEYQWP